MRSLEDVGDGVWDVVEGELVHAEVPEAARGRGRVDAFLGVLVSTVVAEPDVVSALDQLKWQASLFVGQADPDLAVHHETVVEVDDLLLDALGPVSAVDAHVFLALSPAQPVQTQEIAIARLHNVFLAVVAVEVAELGKVGGIGDGAPHALLLLARALGRGRREVVEQAAREAVAEVDNRRGQGKRDDGNEGLEADEADGEKQGDVLADVEARQEGYMERHAAQVPSGVCRRAGHRSN